MKFSLHPCFLSLSVLTGASLAAPALAGEPHELTPVPVVAHHGPAPLQFIVDPRAPAQPMPAQDGADALRSVPGFNVIRKGGTDGDPVFRGLAGSRLGILLDGELIFGGCGNRMDPPTAYVFPTAFDRVTIIKGPQSVLHGPGLTAGVVLFERIPMVCTEPEFTGIAALTLGAFGRNDQLLDATAGNPRFSLRATATRTAADDYKDGSGNRVHSQYERWSAHANGTWHATPRTRIELSGTLSDGEAAYADRAMDGTQFARENIGLRFRHETTNGLLAAIEGQAYYNYIDHVMDNFSLRTFSPTMMMPNKTVSNPDRETFGARVLGHLESEGPWQATLGTEFQENRHTGRRSMNEDMRPFKSLPRLRDGRFRTTSIFGEGTWDLDGESRLVAGLRADLWRAEDPRAMINVGMAGAQPNPTAGSTRRQTLPTGFLRYERTFAGSLHAYLGLGHARRFPDFWEMINKEGPPSLSAFETKIERTTQIDLGFTQTHGATTYGLSLFANQIDDFILIENGFPKGMRSATVARNIDARMLGGEATVLHRLGDHWRAEAALSHVHGRNRTDARPLAQQPPFEGRLALGYHETRWSAGGVLRAVARQNRIAVGQGNIVGQDLGPTPGFATLALHGGWMPHPAFRLHAGVDNLLDHTYAEHLSKGGAMVAGFPPPTTRVNEPGRTFWLRGEVRF
ncbi:MAG: TonB-dependent copper receptor [Opitutales bacterium]|nr:TonB-dependent copper receptor [Opitutales bacterium]